jgi:hypothetical protein
LRTGYEAISRKLLLFALFLKGPFRQLAVFGSVFNRIKGNTAKPQANEPAGNANYDLYGNDGAKLTYYLPGTPVNFSSIKAYI